eukprot:TRINITY_DN2791_c0_g2_i1.p1 TRINITY_DN2791_c0_g2~~TRINITY_DN2791_c0_g2_i1.p1  ORF type:complete len:352 (-),score=44.84 TRINITY_DN2791_c0_g2_i1:126-1136(-)
MSAKLLMWFAKIITISCALLAACVILLYLPVWKLQYGVSMTLLVVSMIFLFFGGIFFNMMGWSALAEQLCRCQPFFAFVTVPPFLMFTYIVVMTVSSDGLLPEYMRITSDPPLQQISVCDWPTWKTSEGGLYFRDGVLTRNGIDVGGAVERVERCRLDSKKNTMISCQFGVRPIFRCDSTTGNCDDESPCAWAVKVNPGGAEATAPAAVPCGNVGGLCGFVYKVEELGFTDSSESKESYAQMAAAIQKVAMALNVSYSGEAPMIEFANPIEVRDGLYPFYVVWWCVTFLYTVAPGIIILIGFVFIDMEERQEKESPPTDANNDEIRLVGRPCVPEA